MIKTQREATPMPEEADWQAVGYATRRGAAPRSDNPAVATGERGSKPRRVALPTGWTLTPDRAAWAAEHCPHVLYPRLATEKFTSYYGARPAEKRTLAEWESAWQTWLLGDENRALERAAERGMKAPTVTNGSTPENPATRRLLEERRAALAARDARIAAAKAQRAQGVQ